MTTIWQHQDIPNTSQHHQYHPAQQWIMNPSPPDLQRYIASLLHSASSVLPAAFAHRLHQTKPAAFPKPFPDFGVLVSAWETVGWHVAGGNITSPYFSATKRGTTSQLRLHFCFEMKDLGRILLQILRYTLRLLCQLSLKYTKGKANNYFYEFHCNEVFWPENKNKPQSNQRSIWVGVESWDLAWVPWILNPLWPEPINESWSSCSISHLLLSCRFFLLLFLLLWSTWFLNGNEIYCLAQRETSRNQNMTK